MVTEAGKELLRNTINTATFHNRILEENEMWKRWEKECGLTMMISDDDILKKYRKHHQCSKHRKRDKSRDRGKHIVEKGSLPPGPSKSDAERWDHNGFKELYPDEDVQERWDHSGFKELYPDEVVQERWDHSGFKELYPDEDIQETCASASSSKSHSSKQKKKKKKRHRKNSTSDSEIWEEFKRYRRSKREECKKLKPEKSKSNLSGFDSHIKECKKLREKSQ